MNYSRFVDTTLCYLIAWGLALFSACELLPLGDRIGLFKEVVGTPLHALRDDTAFRILLILLLVGASWFIIDWLLKSRTKTILMNIAALIVVLWFKVGPS
jgi:hypothetical protein